MSDEGLSMTELCSALLEKRHPPYIDSFCELAALVVTALNHLLSCARPEGGR